MTTTTSAPAQGTAVPESRTQPGLPAAPARFSGLDGLRALAVVAVIVYHVFPGVLPGGFIGVDVFFVISGFLITSLLVRERTTTGRIDLRRFWVRRGRRLLPALIALVIVCSSAAFIVGGNALVGIGRQILGAATFSNNWLDIAADSSYFARDAPEIFRNLWSLAVEEQFYVVWPLALLLILLVRSWGARLAIVSTIAAASAIWMAVLYVPGSDATRVYFGSDTHSFGLAIGAALALLVSRMKPIDLDAGESPLQVFVRRWLPPLGALSLLALAAVAWALHDDATFTYRGGLVLVSLLTAIAIWAAVAPQSTIGRALDVAPLRYVGRRSYALYLWHWPVLVLVVASAGATGGDTWIVGAITLVITVAASMVSYRFLEQPIRRHGFGVTMRFALQRMRSSRRARALGIGTLAFAVVLTAGTVAAAATAPKRTDAQAFIERGQQAVAGAKTSPSPAPTHPPAPHGAPNPHPVAAGPDIMAIGDSVMLASAPSLQQELPGIAIDAVVSRQMRAAPAILQAAADAGTLRKVILIGLGTNGAISSDTLAQLVQIAGPKRQLVFVTVQAPRGWTDGVNTTLSACAGAHQQSVVLAEWKAAITPHLDLLADDQIHPGSRGGRIYAQTVEDALLRLAERSPVRPYVVWSGQGPRPQ